MYTRAKTLVPTTLLTLAVLMAAPAAAQTAAAQRAAGPERTAFLRPTATLITVPALASPGADLGAVSAADADLPLQAPAFVRRLGKTASEQVSSSRWSARRILDVAVLAVGGSLVAGALTDYAVGTGHWGMTRSELGAFGAGAALAAWGGLRVARWRGPRR